MQTQRQQHRASPSFVVQLPEDRAALRVALSHGTDLRGDHCTTPPRPPCARWWAACTVDGVIAEQKRGHWQAEAAELILQQILNDVRVGRS